MTKEYTDDQLDQARQDSKFWQEAGYSNQDAYFDALLADMN